jgi:two-component system CheB/CheR fusion protein
MKSKKPAGESVSPDDKGPCFPVAGIGASAGGLEAITDMLVHLGDTSGLAVIYAQHADAPAESALPEILARVTKLDVVEARNNMRLEPGRLIVIKPGRELRVEGDHIKLVSRKPNEQRQHAIDRFLKSLAAARGSDAVGVILSGDGSDGAEGLAAIREAGGSTIAQSEQTAGHPSMPGAAVRAGVADLVLSPAEIAESLADLAVSGPVGLQQRRKENRALQGIIEEIHRGVGVNFSEYKKPTLQRRIRRRIDIKGLPDFNAYLRYLRTHPAEIRELYEDILIQVTSFFRDETMFTALRKKIIPELFKNRSPAHPVRVWVPGCSTGEEVYSLAILFHEVMEELKINHPVQFFGTDINNTALERARAGRYTAELAGRISVRRLERYFNKTHDGYRIAKSIRQSCIFARQNMLVDPPFSRIDLLSCRNVLIYLGSSLQHRVLPVFHYALGSGGYMVLGQAESAAAFNDLFELVDNRHKIYRKRQYDQRPALFFRPYVASSETAQLALRQKVDDAWLEVSKALPGSTGEKSDKKSMNTKRKKQTGTTKSAEPDREVRELSLLREELDGAREALQSIIEEHEATAEELRSANEEILSSNEELQSANEELETAKEELQSTNEELTTLNDELESRNHELEDVNNHLHNLMANIDIPVVMFGRDFRIRLFTSSCTRLLKLIPGDVGRPITDIKMNVEVPGFEALVNDLLENLQTRELELQDSLGQWWMVRLRTYKTTDNKIDGVVMAFVDINSLKKGRADA